jgi:TolB-like protein
MNARLIDTRTDTHVWVAQYDRELNDLFAIQSESFDPNVLRMF